MSSVISSITAHILASLHQSKPLFVSLQGPQGCGKTYLTSHLHTTLSSTPHNLVVAILSIDDLYLPYHTLQSLANAGNPLYQGRGPPGTHDVALGISVLESLKEGNDTKIPVFEKSLYAGFGDRLEKEKWTSIVGEVDVVIMEGWCMGFYPIDEDELSRRWEGVWKQEQQRLALNGLCEFKDVKEVNGKLKEYLHLWEMFHVFVQIKPNVEESIESSPYSLIYRWRLEQEHNMKSRNGGIGMEDWQVKRFIDRYIPGYVFFGDGITHGLNTSPSEEVKDFPPWKGKGLIVTIGAERELVRTAGF